MRQNNNNGWTIWPALAGAAAYLLAAAASAQVYKYTDENGIINYTNKPPSSRRYDVEFLGCYGTCRRKIDWNEVPLKPRAFRGTIQRQAKAYQLEESLLRAVIHAESSFKAGALSPKGAQGLMQLMPDTQARFGVDDPYVPEDNVRAGAAYLRELLDSYSYDLDRALAAYNAGPSAVEEHGGVPPYRETEEYVERVRILYGRYGAVGVGGATASVGASGSP